MSNCPFPEHPRRRLLSIHCTFRRVAREPKAHTVPERSFSIKSGPLRHTEDLRHCFRQWRAEVVCAIERPHAASLHTLQNARIDRRAFNKVGPAIDTAAQRESWAIDQVRAGANSLASNAIGAIGKVCDIGKVGATGKICSAFSLVNHADAPLLQQWHSKDGIESRWDGHEKRSSTSAGLDSSAAQRRGCSVLGRGERRRRALPCKCRWTAHSRRCGLARFKIVHGDGA